MNSVASLNGFRVIDLTQGLCGPFCTMQLGDAGAEVIKIEPPAGDFARRMGPPFVGNESAVYLSLNRNKKSVVLDLETSDGREAAVLLTRDADVLVEDFGPDAAKAFGLGYAQLHEANPKLVYCSITPFGENGPLRDAPGSELVVQAMAEYTASLGRIGDPPVRVGADVASLNTGIFAAQAILAGLFHRIKTGEGQRVAVSEFGSLLHMRGIMWHSMSDPDDWYGFHLDHYTKAPDYGYQAKNGSLYFILRRGSNEDWDRLVMEFGMEEVLADPRFDDYGRAATSIGRYATEVKPIWEKAFANRTREEIIDLIKSVGGDAVPMMGYPSLLAHPQVAAIEAIAEIDHPTAGRFKTVRPVARFSETPDSIRLPPPTLGQHTEEVLRAGIAVAKSRTGQHLIEEADMIVPARKTYKVITEKNIPMKARDGVTLFADVIRPDAPGRFPVLLSRTPYNKKGSDDPNGAGHLFARYGYISVMQDCRGRFESEGEYDTIFQEVADGYDAVEWAARLPWSNGRVGTTGQSYLGLTQYMIACNDPMPPSLEVMAPVSASSDYHASWIYHTGGASLWGWIIPYAIFKGLNTLKRAKRNDLFERMKEYVEGGEFPIIRQTRFGLNAFTPLTEKWYRHLPIKDWVELLKETAPYLADHIAHADDGEYWYRANVNRHAASINVPMLHVTSWYDIFGEGGQTAYRSIKANSTFDKARNGQRLIIGPWGHLLPYNVPSSRGTGDIDFGPAALIDLNETLLRWFDYWLKDVDNGIIDEPPVTIFTMGENRWQKLSDWPPSNMRQVRYFLHSRNGANSLVGDGALSTVPPDAERADTYVYDPNDPVPSLGGNNLAIDIGVQDQRPVEERADVLVYTSDPMEESLEVTGPVTVVLWASSSAIDTDFTAKLIDVDPDGYARNLLDGIIRARYRDSASAPKLMEAGKPYLFTIDLWSTSNVFRPGHRIRLEISSSNFPRFDRNLNTGEPFGEGTKGIPAHQTIFHQTDMASCLLLPVIPR